MGRATFEVIAKDVVEFVGVLLLPHVHRFSMELESLDKTRWSIELFDRLLKVSKSVLKLLKN